MKPILIALLIMPFIALSGCPESSPDEVEPNVEVETTSPVKEVKTPVLKVLGIPVPEKCTLVDRFTQTNEERSVRVYESDETRVALVEFYEVELKQTSKAHRLRDRVEYLWSWKEEGMEKKVILRPVDPALKGNVFQKENTITLVSAPLAVEESER